MMTEREPRPEYDLFLNDLTRYMRDVMALEADGEADKDNNCFRLTGAFDSMLERLGMPDDIVVEKLHTLLPTRDAYELDLPELVLRYKLVPLHMLNQRQPNCVLPLESLTPKRIERVFDLALAGEETSHTDCITGHELGRLACEQTSCCPMRLGRQVGKDLLGLFMIQRHLHEGSIEPKNDPIFYNLLQLKETLVMHQLMLVTEVDTYAKQAVLYIDEQLTYLQPPDSPRTNDETNGTDL